jgi:hypothetical protein
VKKTEPEAQSTSTPPSGGYPAAVHSNPDVEAGPNQDKSSAAVSEIEIIPLSTP